MATMPQRPEELTVGFLNDLLGEAHPGAAVADFELVDVKRYGDADTATSVSTSARARCRVRYRAGEELPEDWLVKMSLPDDEDSANPDLDAEFVNEVDFYRKLRPELTLETPRTLGGRWHAASRRYVLLIEDLTPKAPAFPTMAGEDDVPAAEAVLDTFARLHAHYWESPRFRGNLGWIQDQLSGPLEQLFDTTVRVHIQHELVREKFKRELVAELGTTEADLFAAMKAVKRHQATLPQTFLHGDGHVANSYTLPDGTGGLIDWQVSARGFLMHDIAYFIQSALSIQGRRRHERDLLRLYREALRAHGVTDPPSDETLWHEYRMALVYGFHMGWLTAPRENYGLEVCVIGNHRTQTACQDHETLKLIAAIM